ncbi:hypothetical protein U9M48_027584 [Paspalum notatum var. saurae]|uniref:Uncharacterized protein n=1 Tax=Paspalum notatum var. saurae TaxID=547442 RepID=A0AAQ3TXI8_PASNO
MSSPRVGFAVAGATIPAHLGFKCRLPTRRAARVNAAPPRVHRPSQRFRERKINTRATIDR